MRVSFNNSKIKWLKNNKKAQRRRKQKQIEDSSCIISKCQKLFPNKKE